VRAFFTFGELNRFKRFGLLGLALGLAFSSSLHAQDLFCEGDEDDLDQIFKGAAEWQGPPFLLPPDEQIDSAQNKSVPNSAKAEPMTLLLREPPAAQNQTRALSAEMLEMEQVLAQASVLGAINNRAEILFRYYQEARDAHLSEEATNAYWGVYDELLPIIREKAAVMSLSDSPENLTSRYLTATMNLLSYYERWSSPDLQNDPQRIPQFKTSDDPSLITAFAPQQDLSKENLRAFLLEEGFKDPERFILRIETVFNDIVMAEHALAGLQNDQEKLSYKEKTLGLPDRDQRGFARGRGGRYAYEEYRDLARAWAAHVVLEDSYFIKSGLGQINLLQDERGMITGFEPMASSPQGVAALGRGAVRLSQRKSEALDLVFLDQPSLEPDTFTWRADRTAQSLREEFFESQNLGAISPTVLGAALSKLSQRRLQDRLLRELENNPEARAQHDRMRHYTGATDLEMAQAKAIALEIRKPEETLDLVAYELQALPQVEYQRRQLLNTESLKSYRQKEDRIRFMLAAELANPQLAATQNQLEEANRFLLEYSKEELLHLHYLRSWIPKMELKKSQSSQSISQQGERWSLKDLEQLTRRVRRFDSLWSKAFLKAPQIRFESSKDFLERAPDLEAVVLAKEERFPGLPFEYLGLGQNFERTKLLYDRAEAEEISLFQYQLGIVNEQNSELRIPRVGVPTPGIFPVPDYRWINSENFFEDAQRLFVQWDARRRSLVLELRRRLSEAVETQLKKGRELSQKEKANIQKEKSEIARKLQAINQMSESERAQTSALELENLVQEKQDLESRLELLNRRESDYSALERNQDFVMLQVLQTSFEDWDHFQLEQLAHLTEKVDGKERFAWDKPIHASSTTLLDFVLNFNAQSPVAAVQFSALRNLITEYALFKRLYDQNPIDYIAGRPEEVRGVAEFLRATEKERRDLVMSLREDQRFAARFSSGGWAREDRSGIRFHTPMGARWIEARRLEMVRHLRSKGIDVPWRDQKEIARDNEGRALDPEVQRWEEHLDQLLADAAEIEVRIAQSQRLSDQEGGERLAHLQKVIRAELSGVLDLLGPDLLKHLASQGPHQFEAPAKALRGAEREKFLNFASQDLSKRILEDNFDYDRFIELWGGLLYQMQSLGFREQANPERAQMESRAIAEELLQMIEAKRPPSEASKSGAKSNSKSSADGYQSLKYLLQSIASGERRGTRLQWEEITVPSDFGGGMESTVGYRPVDVVEKFDLAAFAKASSALREASVDADKKMPVERLQGLYRWIEERYLESERELKITQADRSQMAAQYRDAAHRYLKTIGYTQSPRARDQKTSEDTTQLYEEEMVGVGKTMLSNWGVLGLTYKESRFISHDAVMRNIFQTWNRSWLRQRPELDMQTWFNLPKSDPDPEKMQIKGDENGYVKRLLRFVGVLSDDPRRLSEWGRQNLKVNKKAEEEAVRILNLEAWEVQRNVLQEMAAHFFEGGEAVYQSLNDPGVLTRYQILQILEQVNLHPKTYTALSVASHELLSLGGNRVSEEDAQKILEPVGLWSYYKNDAANRRAIRAQLGQLRRFVSASNHLFRAEEEENKMAWTDILGQIVAPAFMKELMAGEGSPAPVSFAMGVEALDQGRKTEATLRVQRNEILRERLSHLALAFEDSSAETKAVMDGLFESLKDLSDKDLELFWKEFSSYVESIRKFNDSAVEKKFFLAGSEQEPADERIKRESLIRSGFLRSERRVLGPTEAFKELQKNFKNLSVLKDPRVEAAFQYFSGPRRLENGQEIWPSFQAKLFSLKEQKVGMGVDSWGRLLSNETQALAAIPFDQDYAKNASLRELHFRRAFPSFSFAEEQRFENSKGGLLDEKPAKEIVSTRWRSLIEALTQVDPALVSAMPKEFPPSALEAYGRGAFDPGRLFRSLGALISKSADEVGLLKMAETDRALFAEIFWSMRRTMQDTLNEDLVLLDLFEGGVYDDQGRLKESVGPLKESKLQVAQEVIKKYFTHVKAIDLQEIRSVSRPIQKDLKLENWLSLFEKKNPFEALSVLQPKEGEEPQQQVLSREVQTLLGRMAFSFGDENRLEADQRKIELSRWLLTRLDEFSKPWFKEQASYDPPYRSRLLTSPNPDAKMEDLRHFAQKEMLESLRSSSGQFIDGSAEYSGAETLLRSPMLYGTYFEEFLGELRKGGRYHPALGTRVGEGDVTRIRMNAMKISEDLKILNDSSTPSLLSVEEAERLLRRQFDRTSQGSQEEKRRHAVLLSSSGDLDRDRALRVLVLDELEEQKSSLRISEEDLFAIVRWTLSDLSERNAQGNLVDEKRIDSNVITRADRGDLKTEELLEIARATGILELEKKVQESSGDFVSALNVIREVIRKALPIAEEESSRKRLQAARDLGQGLTEALQMNALYSGLFTLTAKAAQQSEALLEASRDLLRMQQALELPMDGILKGMETMSYEQSLMQAQMAKEQLRQMERANTNFALRFVQGTGDVMAMFFGGAFHAVVETGYWLLETPAVLARADTMTDEQFYRFIKLRNLEAARAQAAGEFSFVGRYSGWKDEYIESSDNAYFIAQHAVNAGSLLFPALKALKPVQVAGRSAAAVAAGTTGRAVARAELTESVLREGVSAAGESSVLAARNAPGAMTLATAEEVAAAAGRGRMSKLADYLRKLKDPATYTKERYIFAKPMDVTQGSVQQAISEMGRRGRSLATDGFDWRVTPRQWGRNTWDISKVMAWNTLPLTVAMPLAAYPFSGPDDEGYWGEAARQAGMGLGVIPTFMLTHVLLHKLASKGGRWRFAAYANKNLISDPLQFYILRTSAQSGMESTYIWGNRWDLWGEDYLYERVAFDESGYPKIVEGRPETQEAFDLYMKHQNSQANFVSHLLIVGFMRYGPKFADWQATRALRAGHFERANSWQSLGSPNREITDEQLVAAVRSKYIEGFQSSLKAAPRDKNGNLLKPEEAIARAREVASNRLLAFRDQVLDGSRLREVANSMTGDLRVAADDVVQALRGRKGGLGDADLQVIRDKFNKVFERGLAEAEMWAISHRRWQDYFNQYRGVNGQFDVSKFFEERGVQKWMQEMQQKYGEGRRDWSKLSESERRAEIERLQSMADDPMTQALFKMFTQGGSREGDLFTQIVSRRLADADAGRPIDASLYGSDLMNLWPNLEAFTRFLNRARTLDEGSFFALPSGETVKVSAREASREGIQRDGFARVRFEDGSGNELLSAQQTPVAHKWTSPLGRERLDVHGPRLRLEYDDLQKDPRAWQARMNLEGEVRLERVVDGKYEEVWIRPERGQVLIRRQGKESLYEIRSEAKNLEVALKDLGIELKSIPLPEAGALSSPSLVVNQPTASGRRLHQHLDAEGQQLKGEDGRAYVFSWKPESARGTELLDVPSLQTRFEFSPANVKSGIELGSRDILFETPTARVRIRGRSDLHEGEVSVIQNGREVVYETIAEAQVPLAQLGIRVRGLSAPEKPPQLAPGAKVHEGVAGYFNLDRIRGPGWSDADYSVQYYRIKYRRLGKTVEGWVKMENIGGTQRATYPDGSESYSLWVKPDAARRDLVPVDEVANQQRIVEGPRAEDGPPSQIVLTTPKSVGDAASSNRVDTRRAPSVDPEKGTEYVIKLPPAAEGEVRYVVPSGDHRGRIHLIDRNGIETIIDPKSQMIRFKFADSEVDVLAPIAIRDFLDIQRAVGPQGVQVSERLLSHVVNDFMALRHQTLTGASSVAPLQPGRASSFDLDFRLEKMGIPATGGFKTKPLTEQVKALNEAYTLRAELIKLEPAGILRDMRLTELNQYYRDMKNYLQWLHSKPGQPWARPETKTFWEKTTDRLVDWYKSGKK
jgi:hypothetical protein